MKFYNGETNIVCSNLENSLKFYKDILGFEFIEEDGEAVRLKLCNQYYLLLPVAQQRIERNKYCEFPEVSLDLMVDNILEAEKYFKNLNVEFVKTLKDGEKWFIISDPDGLVLEVIQK